MGIKDASQISAHFPVVLSDPNVLAMFRHNVADRVLVHGVSHRLQTLQLSSLCVLQEKLSGFMSMGSSTSNPE